MALKITIEFTSGNDAFVEDFEGEVTRILETARRNIARGHFDAVLKDSNGNTVGSHFAKIIED